MTEKIIEKMIDYYQGNKRDVAHFLKVYAYARAIGLMEGLSAADQDMLEIAAVVHDIACPFCREKYGSAAGNLQEKERKWYGYIGCKAKYYYKVQYADFGAAWKL